MYKNIFLPEHVRYRSPPEEELKNGQRWDIVPTGEERGSSGRLVNFSLQCLQNSSFGDCWVGVFWYGNLAEKKLRDGRSIENVKY